MALSVFMMLLFSVLLIMWDYRKKYSLLFVLMMLGMSLAMLALLMETSRVSNYSAQVGVTVSLLELKTYRLINSWFKMSFSALLIMRNLGIVIYLAANVGFVYSFNNSIRTESEMLYTKKNRFQYLLLILYPIIFFLIYHPTTAFLIYRDYQLSASPEHKATVEQLLSFAHGVMTVSFLLYLSYPVVYLIINRLKKNILFFTEQLVSLAVSLTILNLTIFLLFFTGDFRPSVENVLQVGFWRYKLATQTPPFYTTTLPILSAIILAVLFFLIVHFRTNNAIGWIKAHGIRKNLQQLYSNVRNTLHSNKNQFFSIRILAQTALDHYGQEDGKAALTKLLAICDNNLKETSKLLDSTKRMEMHSMEHNLVHTLDHVLASTAIPPEITVEKNYQQPEIIFRYDDYHVTQAITNLLCNAVDSFASYTVENPTIRLNAYAGRSWAYVSITDNGCGIPKSLLKSVYKPHVSTKRKGLNWGIGLSYVYSVIKAHYGDVRIHSRQGKYTTVEILLPKQRIWR